MKDLSKFNIPKKNLENAKEAEKKQQPVNTKKKKLVIIAIVCLLTVAVGSKLINKHLKKKKAQEQALLAESPANKKETTDSKETVTKQKPKEDAKSDSKKMVFTFYDHLKNESVEVDAVPSAERAQYKYSYIYQIASFRNMNEASYYVKKMKAQGLEPQFKQVGSWIRMYIGPYDSTRAIAPDIIKLQRMGLNGGFTREISRTKIEPKDTAKKDNIKDKEMTDDKAETAKLELQT
ncbi:SPOR domain-containing protein [Francisellaceae bacterium CB300]